MSFQGSQGQLTFFLGNKSTSALQRLILVVPPQPQFLFQMGQVPPLLEAKKQVQVNCQTLATSARLYISIAARDCRESGACVKRPGLHLHVRSVLVCPRPYSFVTTSLGIHHYSQKNCLCTKYLPKG